MTAVANWVKQAVSGTPGTGTITLGSASTGFIAIGDAFPHDMVLEYIVEDGNNREHGLGTYTHSGTTLARTKVIETLSSGTYDATAPSALTLTSAAVVYLAVGSGAMFTPHKKPENADVDHSYFDNYVSITNTATDSHTGDRLYYLPVFLGKVENLDALWVVVNTVGSATKSRMGLYTWAADGRPGDLIVQSGDATPATDSLLHTFTAQAIQPGWYYCAFVADANITLRVMPTEHLPSWSSNVSAMSDATVISINGFFETATSWTVLPASSGTLTVFTGNPRTIVGFRRV